MNRNGVVDIADLEPLGRWFGMNLDEFMENGGSSANHFNRLDSNQDSVIGLADVITIAQHYREQIDGYRLYKRVDGGPWEWLPNATQPGSSVTMTHAEASDGLVYNEFSRYEYFDANIIEADIAYWAVPVFLAGEEEGIGSWPHTIHPYMDESVRPGILPVVREEEFEATHEEGIVIVIVGAEAPCTVQIDFESDGTWDDQLIVTVGNRARFRHSFSEVGAVCVTSRAVSSEGLVAFGQSLVVVRGPNRPASIRLAASLSGSTAPCTVHLTIDLLDPDGDARLPWVQWEPDIPLVPKSDRTLGPATRTADFIIEVPGTYTATATASDYPYAETSSTITVVVP
jgi:hypothetical protein